MGKSKRKPYGAYVYYFSNKKDKRIANKRFRRHNKQALLKGEDIYYRLRECSDVWSFSSDGLVHYLPSVCWYQRSEEEKEEYIKKSQRK